jgi:two-component system, LytTR family, response regulator
MDKIRIGIVEDDLLSAALLQQELSTMGYEVPEPCTDYDQAILMLVSNPPDLVVLDIRLDGEKGGIDIAAYIRKHMDIPFIFLTANADKNTLNNAKSVMPYAFLVKPFKQSDLYAAIEIAINNFSFKEKKSAGSTNEEVYVKNDFMFIKDGDYFYKVMIDDIQYLASDNVYVMVYTEQKKFTVRTSLNEYLEKFEPSKFIRVHQRYAVNVNKIDKTNSNDLLIGKNKIPISKSYKTQLMKKLNLST